MEDMWSGGGREMGYLDVYSPMLVMLSLELIVPMRTIRQRTVRMIYGINGKRREEGN
jgi:hypothetical protein